MLAAGVDEVDEDQSSQVCSKLVVVEGVGVLLVLVIFTGEEVVLSADVELDDQSAQVCSSLELVRELVVSAGLLLVLVVLTAVEVLVVFVIFSGLELELVVLVRASLGEVVDCAGLLDVELVDSAGLLDVFDVLAVEYSQSDQVCSVLDDSAGKLLVLEELYEEVVVELLVDLYGGRVAELIFDVDDGDEVVELKEGRVAELSVALEDVDQAYEVLNELEEVVCELAIVENIDLVVELVVETATGDDVVD